MNGVTDTATVPNLTKLWNCKGNQRVTPLEISQGVNELIVLLNEKS